MTSSPRGGSGGVQARSEGRGFLWAMEPYRKAHRMLEIVTRRRRTMVDLGLSRTRLEEELARINKRNADKEGRGREPKKDED